ncbi:MAG: alpha/beta fold hydrolase [Thermoanaerobaculia bacterium]
MLNGGMMTLSSWEPVAAVLEPRFGVLRFDFRGQLLSPAEPPADLAGHADDLGSLLDSLRIDSTHLVGASFGALVALEFAARHPERVRSLVLITAMDHVTPEFRQDSDRMRAILAGVLAGEDRGAFYDALVAGVYSTSYLRREEAAIAARRAQIDLLPLPWFAAVDRLLASIESFDLAPQIAAIRCPSAVLVAAEDRVMAPERSLALAEALGAEVSTHPTSGHGLVIEEPAWVADEVLRHLERWERFEL